MIYFIKQMLAFLKFIYSYFIGDLGAAASANHNFGSIMKAPFSVQAATDACLATNNYEAFLLFVLLFTVLCRNSMIFTLFFLVYVYVPAFEHCETCCSTEYSRQLRAPWNHKGQFVIIAHGVGVQMDQVEEIT